MNLTYSRQKIQFLELAWKLLSCIAVVPRCNFDKGTVVSSKLHKIYSLTLASFIIFSYSLHHYFLWKNPWYNQQQFSIILLEISKLIAFLIRLTSTLSSIWGVNRWKRLFQCFLTLEKYLESKVCKEKSFLKNFYFQFILTNLVVAVVLTNVFLSWSIYLQRRADLWLLAIHIHNTVLIYVAVLKMTIIYNLTLAIKCKYQDLNRFLITGCCCNHWETPKTIRTVSQLYRLLGEIVNTFNKLFGWEILLCFLLSIVTEMACFDLITRMYSKSISGSTSQLLHLLSNFICLFLVSMVSCLFYSLLYFV